MIEIKAERLCGVELTGNEAVISLLTVEEGAMFHLPDCRATRIACKNPDSVSELKYFQKTFEQLVQDYKIDTLVIRERMKKGKFAGGANGFKLEAALQLSDKLNVVLLNPTKIKENLKLYPMPITFAETGLKKFQETSFTAAFAYYAGKHEW
ncbi:MAG: hypothetical protein ISEC1_P0535 [Thiomicrorhabdus sp.]|nr:MAG: hypothetical protein ISEC1_P0535 [Thiomicrorhabdus sp.]